MSIYGIGEVFVKVKDLERAIRFYRDLLGLEVGPIFNKQAYFRFGTCHLVLKEEGSPGHNAGGPMHFAFVTATERIEEIAAKFAELDYKTRGPVTFEGDLGCRAFFVFDDDGNEVEFSDLYYSHYAEP